MKQSELFNHNGVEVSQTHLVVHGKSFLMDEISSFRVAESNTLSSLGVLFMFIGLLLLIEEDSLFVFGGVFLIVGLLLRFAHDPAYSLFITISKVEKSVYVSKDIVLLNKIVNSLQTAKAGRSNQSSNFQPPYETTLS
jgi:hypothetical protein